MERNVLLLGHRRRAAVNDWFGLVSYNFFTRNHLIVLLTHCSLPIHLSLTHKHRFSLLLVHLLLLFLLPCLPGRLLIPLPCQRRLHLPHHSDNAETKTERDRGGGGAGEECQEVEKHNEYQYVSVFFYFLSAMLHVPGILIGEGWLLAG
jgi:hypothetical protein